MRNIRSQRLLPGQCQVIIGLYLYVGLVCPGTTPVLPLTCHLSLTPVERRPSTQMNSLITDDRPHCSLLVEALKCDGVNKRSSASMDKSFDGMHEKYDFDSIRCSVKKTISISMIVTSVFQLVVKLFNEYINDVVI